MPAMAATISARRRRERRRGHLDAPARARPAPGAGGRRVARREVVPAAGGLRGLRVVRRFPATVAAVLPTGRSFALAATAPARPLTAWGRPSSVVGPPGGGPLDLAQHLDLGLELD